ncbi:MAG TPA: hypothetical protein PLD23_12890 [Armatimonadota bacterium]|nr:hypothetical protein [Armatimonadota bacterium]HQK94401.1 hypothetical protein [Armatimonadota bacterium]
MPVFQIEDRTFTRLILGHNPLLGYSYLSHARCREYAERFATYEPIRDVIVAALRMGVRSIMISPGGEQSDRVAQAIEAAQEHTGITMSNLVIVGPDIPSQMDYLKRVGCQVCLVHGQVTDSMFWRAEWTFRPEFAELLAAIRAAGFVPGMSSHNGGETVPVAERFDVQVINTPVNKIAWRMCPCVEQVLEAVRRSTRKIIAMKPLAMGRIAPQEALEYALQVPGVDALCIGIATPAEAEETFAIGAEVLARTGCTNGRGASA